MPGDRVWVVSAAAPGSDWLERPILFHEWPDPNLGMYQRNFEGMVDALGLEPRTR